MAEELSDKRKQALVEGIKAARADFEARQDEVEEAKGRYHDAVRELHQAGVPLREIASHLGLSHQRVHQILTGDKPRRRRRNVARGIGAAGIVVALVLSSVSLLDQPQRPERRRVALAQDRPITRNDIRLAHRFERSIASGRIAGKRWQFLVSYVGGIYCKRFRWEPGPAAQGEICGHIPSRGAGLRAGSGGLSGGNVAVTIDPVGGRRSVNPVLVVQGHIPSAVPIREIIVVSCDGDVVAARTMHVPELPVTFFMAFLPKESLGAHVLVRPYQGDIVTLRSRSCGDRGS